MCWRRSTTGAGGFDSISGGVGADIFVFKWSSEGKDTVSDFVSGTDTLEFSATGFGGGLTTGMDAAIVFGSSGGATFGSATERCHLDTTTGTLYFDADGSDLGAPAVAIVQLLAVAVLQSSDFVLV